MKLFAAVIALFVLTQCARAQNTWYVAPNGSSSNPGTQSAPWDLATGLSSSAIKPGDTVWLRHGVYGNGGTIFISTLNGTSSQPITVRQYPGEIATVNGGLEVDGTYTWYWGFEVTNQSITNRVSAAPGEAPPANFPSGFTISGSQNKFINLIVHDTAEGFGFWSAAQGGEIYGSVIYNNGWQGPGGDRGHGHGIYTQNQTGTKTISDNIIFQGFGEGIQCYGTTTAAYVRNFVFDGNTIFNSGSLQTTGFDYNFLVAGGIGGPQNITVTNTYTYFTPSANHGLSALDWGGSGSNLTANNDYWIGGLPAIEVYSWNGATFTNQTVYAGTGGYLMFAGSLQPSTYTWDNNTYLGANGIELDGSGTTLPGFHSATGLDLHSTYSSANPTTNWVFVRPNKYEAGRANVTIYNWQNSPAVQVDLSKVLTVGKPYTIQNAQNYFAAPVVSGIYDGNPVSIPMTGLTVAAPVGAGVPNMPTSTAPQFGAFVVLSPSSLPPSTLAPPTNVKATVI